MPRGRDLPAVLMLVAALAAPVAAAPAKEAPKGGGLFDLGDLRNRKDPITVTADTLEYDYKANVVVYRGDVLATQGPVKLRSNTLTVTFEGSGGEPGVKSAAPEAPGQGSSRLRELVAVGAVRIDSGTRWATGGKAVFEQGSRTVVLTEEPVMHDGQNEVAGDRVVVYLDEDRSVVEGGRKRVKAVLYPSKDGGLAPAAGTATAPEHPADEAAAKAATP